MKRFILAGAVLSAFLFSQAASAKERIDEKRPLSSNGKLIVENISGSITITGTDEEMMYLTGTKGEGVEAIEIGGSADKVSIRVEMKGGRNNNGSAELEIRIPRNARIEVEGISANVKLIGVTGTAEVETVSGDISISGELKTIELQTVSGDVVVEAASERLEVEAVSGDIRVGKVSGEVELETVSGDVRIAGGQITRFRAKSVSGDIELDGDIYGSGKSNIESHSGDIELRLGTRTDATFEIGTFSGEIDTGKNDEDHGRRRKAAAFVVGKGSARVTVQTFSGDVDIRTP
jgi:DUF4097 and DUF4098 domain-containing protein YvlB